MKRLSHIMEKFFWVFFVVFAVFLVVCSFRKGNMYEKNLLWNWGCLCVFLLFGSLMCHSISISHYFAKHNVVSIFVLSLCVHFLSVWMLGGGINTEQISDFAFALDMSSQSFPLAETSEYYRIFSNWSLYPLYLKLIQELFRYGAFTGIVFNVVICAFSSAFIFILCQLGFRKDNIGYLAALIYTFWPSHLFYCVVLTPEFLNIFLTLLFLILMEIVVRRYDKDSTYILTCLSAVVLALSGFFKSIDKIILVAIVILVILFMLRGQFFKFLSLGNRKCKNVVILSALFVVCYIVSCKLIYTGLDYAYGAKINRNPTMNFIYIGLNPETCGTWNEEAYSVYKGNVIDCKYDFKKASSLTFNELKEGLQEEWYLTPTYFASKFSTAWEDNSEIWWAYITIKEEGSFLKKEAWIQAMNTITQNFWILICFFVCVEAIFLFIRTDRNYLFICLVLFGFACLMLLSEVQPRYKCVMYPIMSILAAGGMVRCIGLCQYMKQKIICLFRLWL